MGGILKQAAPIAELAGSIAFPELAPLIVGGGSLLQGQGLGNSIKNGALAFGGNEIGGALGNAFPETLGSSLGTGGNSLTDALGSTSGAGSFFGPGTIGEDVSNLFNGAGNGTFSGLFDSSAASLPAVSGTPNPSLTSSGLESGTGLTPGSTNAPLYNIGGGGASSFGSSGDIGSQITKGLTDGTGYTAPTGIAGLSASPAVDSLGIAGGYAPAGAFSAAPATASPTTFSSLLGKYALPIAGAAASLGSNFAAQGQLKEATDKANAQLAPYLQNGGAASGTAASYLGLPGSSGAGGNAADILAASPGYQFTLDQGNRALAAHQAATGSLNSGAAQKEAEQFGTGLANQTSQQYFSNLLGTSGQGLSAAGQYGNNTTAMGTAGAASNIATGNTLSQLLSGVGGKRVTGYGTNGQPIYGYGA